MQLRRAPFKVLLHLRPQAKNTSSPSWLLWFHPSVVLPTHSCSPMVKSFHFDSPPRIRCLHLAPSQTPRFIESLKNLAEAHRTRQREFHGGRNGCRQIYQQEKGNQSFCLIGNHRSRPNAKAAWSVMSWLSPASALRDARPCLSRPLPWSLAIIFLLSSSHAGATNAARSSAGRGCQRCCSHHRASPAWLPKGSTPTRASLPQPVPSTRDASTGVVLALSGFWPRGNLGFPFSFRGSILLQKILWGNGLQIKFSHGGPTTPVQDEPARWLQQRPRRKPDPHPPCRSLLG